MHPSTTSRRAGEALAATALVGLITVAPAYARQDPGDLLSTTGSNQGDGAVSNQSPSVLTVDDNAVEYFQVALGALGGVVVVGAVAAAASRRHGHAHPA